MRGPATTIDEAHLIALRAHADGHRQLGLRTSGRPGNVPTRRRGAGTDLREIRPFAEGDDPRHIDAAASARRGTAHVRSFHEDRDRAVMLIADFRRPMLWGTRRRFRSVAAAEALAIRGWQAVAAQSAVGVVAITDGGATALRPRHHAGAMLRIVSELVRAHAEAAARRGVPGPTPSLAAGLRLARTVAPARANILLASALDPSGDDGADDMAQALDALAARGALTVLHLRDAFERERPAGTFAFVAADGAARQGRFSGTEAAVQAGAAIRTVILDTDRDLHVEMSRQ